jgi:hypothetical protein
VADSEVYDGTTNLGSDASLRILNDSVTTGSYSAIKLDSKNDSGSVGQWRIASISTATNYDNDLAFATRTASSTYAERMRIDSGGKLLVGKTSGGNTNTAGFEVQQSGFVGICGDGIRPMQINRKSSDGDIIEFRKDGTTVGSIGAKSGRTYFADDTYGGISFSNNSNNVYPVTNAGATTNGALDLGGSSQRFKDLWLSGGVYLGGTGAANKLDDYEEGTWTPVFSDALSGGNTDEPTSGKRGQYTKIGRQVTVTLSVLNIRTVGMTATNDFFIQGLPFAPISVGSPNQIYSGSVRASSITFSGYMTAFLIDNTTYFRLAEMASGVGVDLVRVTEIADGTADLDVTITYFTAA